MKKENRKKWMCFGGMLLLCVALAACGNETGSEAGEPETDSAGAAGEAADNGAASSEAEKFLAEERQIAEQTFQVEWSPLGSVTFASYAPDVTEHEKMDIVFAVWRGDEVLQVLDGMEADHIRTDRTFAGVEAVSFPDYNGDGVNDVITISSYLMDEDSGVDTDAEGKASEVRIYRGDADGRLVLEKELSQTADSALAVKTVSSVLGFLGADRIPEETAGDSASKNERNLSPEELQAFADYVNERENYGFLLSVYDTPADVDLGEVFYNGAGIGRAPSEEEKAEYLAVTGEEEIYTDIFAIKPETINTFLMEKTGLPYEKMNHPLEWSYLEKSGVYCVEHGDTNYKEFICTAGTTADEKTFTLRFEEDMSYMGETEIAAYRRPDYELVVEKSGDGYRFLSNRRVTEEGQIAEQTFPVTVAGLGDVVFAAYEPDYDQNMQADVTFLLLSKKGEVLQTLSGVRENNVRAVAESYAGVDAVSFPDYNDDGRTDIITITNYSYITGPDIGEGFAEVRVYSGSEHGYFRYEEDISQMIRAEIKTPTIQNVRDFLGDTN